MTEINELYKELILELYRNPLNKFNLKNPDVTFKDSNPFCGDIIEMRIKFKNHSINEIAFQGDGCAISQASASALTEMVKGKNIKDILKLNIDKLLHEIHLENLRKNAVRIKCAALPLKVLKMALFKYLGKKENIEWRDVI
jgi:nitrogen fixation NifU-like protein